MLSVEKLACTHGDSHYLFDEVTFSLNPGERILISGYSGCGKSTLALLLSGLKESGKGQVLLNGSLIEPSDVGFLFQNPDLQFCMDAVAHELYFILENLQIEPEQMQDRSEFVLAQVGLKGFQNRLIYTLSQGEKQRLALATIFLKSPKLIILDEAFANLDQESASQLLQLVLNYQANNQSMLIVIDHLITYYQDIMDHYFWLEKRLTRVNFDYMLNRLNVFELEKKSHNTGDKLLSIKDFQVKLSKNKFISYLDFDLASGERLCLDGPSGVGKSSLFMGLLGLYRTKGKKQFTHRKQIPISFLFQNPLDQFIFSTVYDEIFQVCKDSNKARDILETINLWDKKQFSPFQLSQGQQRRLAIGSILASDSKLLLLDEPTYGQDAYHANMITTLLLSYCHKNHCGVIFTSHDPHLKECFATRFLEVSSCSI